MVTNIRHVYNVIGNREDCLVNTHHCRCSGVYHLDWRVLDQVNISILDIDLRICEIKLHDSWRLHSFEIDVYAFILSLCDIYLRSNSLFSNTTPASIVDMKKKMKNHLLSELLSFFISRNIFFTSYGEEPF